MGLPPQLRTARLLAGRSCGSRGAMVGGTAIVPGRSRSARSRSKEATPSPTSSGSQPSRASADEKSRELQAQAAGAHDEAAQRWEGVRQSWNGHVAEMRRKAAADKAGFDLHRAEHRAKWAEEDALAAVEFAILAVEEAEYEVLDALLARAEADDLAAAKL